MSENPYNPNDPAFRASQSIDGSLSKQDRRRLEDVGGDADSARKEHQAFRAVDRIVKQWGADQIATDEDRFANNVLARIADESNEVGDDVDRLVNQWARSAPHVDEGRYVEAVLGRIQAERAGLRWRPLILRIGLPLAAAAAIALTITAGWWFGDESAVEAPVSMVSYAALESVSDRESTMTTGAAQATRVVKFKRTAMASASRTDNGRGVSFIVVGSSPIDDDLSELPPL